MDTFADIFLNHRDQIGHLLSIDDNNKYENLITQLKIFELQHCSLNSGIYNLFNPNNKNYSFYQLPTHEMISCIIDICKYFDIKNIIEVAAGCGLISYVINKKYGHLISVNTSDGHNGGFEALQGKYGNIENKSFKEINSNDPVLISWLHENSQQEFIEMISRNKPKFIIHLGEGPNGCCYNKEFYHNYLS